MSFSTGMPEVARSVQDNFEKMIFGNVICAKLSVFARRMATCLCRLSALPF